MKLFGKIFGLAVTLLAAVGVVACTNDLSEKNISPENIGAIKPVKTPDAIVYSGAHTFSNSKTGEISSGDAITRVEGPIQNDAYFRTLTYEQSAPTYQKIFDFYGNEFVRDFMFNYSSDLNSPYGGNMEFFYSRYDELEYDVSYDFLYYAPTDIGFNIYLVYLEKGLYPFDFSTGTKYYPYLGFFYYDENGDRHEQNILENIDEDFWYAGQHQNLEYNPETECGVNLIVRGGRKFGFYFSGVEPFWIDPDQKQYFGHPNIYTSSYLNLEKYNVHWTTQPELSGNLALDFFVNGKETGRWKMEGLNGRFLSFCGYTSDPQPKFYSIILYIDTVLPKMPLEWNIGSGDGNTDNSDNTETTEPTDPENPTNPTDPIDPTDPTDPTDPELPDEPVVPGDSEEPEVSTPSGPKFVESEVEVNFALEDVHGNYDIEDLVTKLSIHVRYPHDVEVIIPVPADLYCDQDDLYILKNHYNGNYVYGGESITYDNFIGDNNVSLTVQYVPAEDDDFTGKNQGYIRVYTEGINEEVIKYCQENFGDGINFEVYNYYNKGTMGYGNFKEISYFDLQYNYLSHSMVNFDWQERFENKIYPNLYVNAFNQIKGEPNWGDCYVWIFGDERARYNTDLYKETVTYTGPKGITTGELKWSGSTSAEDYSVERNCFQDPYQGYHKNSSELNWIYVVKGGKTPGDASQTKMPSNPFPFPTTAPQQILVNGSPETCPTYVAK